MAHISGASVFCFDEEKDLLLNWAIFIQKIDPDLFIGYNISNFDLPYLVERARILGIKNFPYLGKFINVQTVTKNSLFSSKAYGTRETKLTSIYLHF